MKTRTNVIIILLLIFGYGCTAVADIATYASVGKSLNTTWNTATLPPGAVVDSVAIATANYMPGPTANYYAVLPSGKGYELHVYTLSGVFIGAEVLPITTTTVSWTGPWDNTYQSSRADAQVGIAGPPAGLVHLARAISTGGTVVDEKISTLAGGTYQVWNGGGVSGNGIVAGYTIITW